MCEGPETTPPLLFSLDPSRVEMKPGGEGGVEGTGKNLKSGVPPSPSQGASNPLLIRRLNSPEGHPLFFHDLFSPGGIRDNPCPSLLPSRPGSQSSRPESARQKFQRSFDHDGKGRSRRCRTPPLRSAHPVCQLRPISGQNGIRVGRIPLGGP